MTQPALATESTDPRLAESLAALAAGSRIRQLAPPFLGDESDIVRRRFAWPTPPNTWTSIVVGRDGRIVSQLGSKPSDAFNFVERRVGYQIEHDIEAGDHLWTASVRVISVSRLPPARTAVAGFLSVTGTVSDHQPLVPGQTQLYTASLSVTSPRRVQLRFGTHQSMVFRAGETAYTEAIVQVQSIVHRRPPSPIDAAADSPAASASRRVEEDEVELFHEEDDVERLDGFDD